MVIRFVQGSHSGLSKGACDIIDSQILYTSMALGSILTIHAEDALTKKPDSFRVQVVGFTLRDEDNKRCDILVPIFRFLDNNFWFYGPDRQTAVRVPKGTLAKAGVSAWHIPGLVYSMIAVGSIGVGRDFSFEHVCEEGREVFASSITGLEQTQPRRGWREPKQAVLRFKNGIERYLAQEPARDKMYAELLMGPLIVRTRNSEYRFTRVDSKGLRTGTKNGTTLGLIWAVVRLGVGCRLLIQQACDNEEDQGTTWETSPVVSFEPDRSTN